MNIERRRNILDFAIASLLRRWLKNSLVLVTFVIVISLFGSVLLMTHALVMEAKKSLVGVPDVTVQGLIAGRQTNVPLAYGEKIRKVRGIKRVVSRVWGYYFDTPTASNYTILGISLSEMPMAERLDLTIDQGRSIDSDLNGEVLVGGGILRARNLKVGDKFSLFRPDATLKTLKIVGSFTSLTDLQSYDLIVMNIDEARDLFMLPKRLATDLCVYVYNDSEADTIAKKISELFSDTRVVPKSQVARTYDAVFNWRSGLVMVVFLGSLMAFAILAWDKATGLSAEERREIGLLKALGWETSDVIELKFWEGLVISLLAFLLGVILAYVHVFFFGAELLRPALTGWSILYPPYRITPYIDPEQLFLIFFVSVIPYMACTIIPSWSAAIIDPEVVMRG